MNFIRFAPSLSRATVAGLLFAASSLAQAGVLSSVLPSVLPFSATVDGVSQIVEVVDPNGPVVRVQTLAFGSGSFGALTYRSGDTINLNNGQGSGTNSFTTPNGDELFGSFTVQLVPGIDASLFDLMGQMLFTGGTGEWAGASGFASFIAQGRFVSASEATTHFQFEGNVGTVPEPSTTVLALLGLLAVVIRLTQQRHASDTTLRRISRH